MEFWIGLSVGMHLGKVIAGYLEKIGAAYGLLEPATIEDIKEIEEAASEMSSISEGVIDE